MRWHCRDLPTAAHKAAGGLGPTASSASLFGSRTTCTCSGNRHHQLNHPRDFRCFGMGALRPNLFSGFSWSDRACNNPSAVDGRPIGCRPDDFLRRGSSRLRTHLRLDPLPSSTAIYVPLGLLVTRTTDCGVWLGVDVCATHESFTARFRQLRVSRTI